MKPGTRIIVEFTTKDKRPHKVVITEDMKVDSIRLNPSRPADDPIPNAFRNQDLDTVSIGDGPGVCYMIDGVLHCW